ncbi:MAG TPA: efflux RND transporter periplasmic adaptor subunit [Chthoniobacterales bacterium]|nr:efflux RND transporter periplasmic adaptor subunit [Chthoniobacterales bacterium]
MKLPLSKNLLVAVIGGALALAAIIYFATLPVAEVALVQRGTAISAVYGTVRIEPALVIPVRAQNSGFIQLAPELSAGRGAIGRNVEKGELLATIADEGTARLLKQARADLQAAQQRAELPLPSSEALKVAEDNLGRLEKLTGLSNVPQVEFEKAKSEVKRLKALVETERIERDRNLAALDEAAKKLESQMKNSEIRSPLDGLLTGIKTIDGELVAERTELFTVSSRKNYVRGEVDEEDVGEVKLGMEAIVQVYAYRTRTFRAKVAAIQPAADVETQRYTIVLDLENPPENLMAGMTGEMNIITGTHQNALLIPTRALLVDQVLLVKHGIVQSRTVKIGYRTLDFSEALDGVSEDDRVVLADQDKLRPGRPVRTRVSKVTPRVNVQ